MAPSAKLGPVRDDQIFQAKGHHYNLERCLASLLLLCRTVPQRPVRHDLSSAALRHRLHMPSPACCEMIYVPGDLV